MKTVKASILISVIISIFAIAYANITMVTDVWRFTIEGETPHYKSVMYLKYLKGQGVDKTNEVAVFRRSPGRDYKIATGTLKKENEKGYLKLKYRRGRKLEGSVVIKDNYMSGVIESVRSYGTQEKVHIQIKHCKELFYDRKTRDWVCQ